MPKTDAAIMPPNTGVPTARRLAAPAPCAMTSGNRPKMKAKLVIITGRKRSRAPSIAGVEDRLAAVALLDRELDDQDAVLGGERDQHDEADLGIDVEAAARRAQPRRCAPSTPTLTDSSTGTGMFQLS